MSRTNEQTQDWPKSTSVVLFGSLIVLEGGGLLVGVDLFGILDTG